MNQESNLPEKICIKFFWTNLTILQSSDKLLDHFVRRYFYFGLTISRHATKKICYASKKVTAAFDKCMVQVEACPKRNIGL